MSVPTIIGPPVSYADARAAFLAAAEAHGATIESHRHPRTGPGGIELHTDVARFGAPVGEARTVVVVGSGTHGVEGNAGSAVQLLLVGSGRLDGLPSGVAVLLVHAINPYGMAWSRRVDQDNVDVNRNFVDFSSRLPANPAYADMSPYLNPAGDDLDLDDASWQDSLWKIAAEIGTTEAYKAISGGQYDEPDGVQFGGQAPSWSARALTAIWARHLAGAATVINLDLHTGLGPNGQLTLFQTADAGDPSAEVAARYYPKVLRFDRPSVDDALSHGVLGPGMEAALPASMLVVPLVVEHGTLDTTTVLSAMRADNWLHHHGDPTSPLGEQIRARTLAAFFVDDEPWRRAVTDDGLTMIHTALDAAGDHPTA